LRVIFSHGHLSSPSSRKIQVLAPLAAGLGFQTEAIDYQDLRDDPYGRVDRLCSRIAALDQPPILVGSSLGGLVSMAAAERMDVAGLFLMAPALYMEDRVPGGRVREAYTPRTEHVCLVHGWHDDIVEPERSLRYASASAASLHLLAADHALDGVLDQIGLLLSDFLRRAAGPKA
jgi:pimeloyl-ACP methyl ester carboxylesterase